MRYAWIVAALLVCGAARPARIVTPFPDPGSLRPAWQFVQDCSGAHPLPGHDFAQLVFLVTPHLEEGGHPIFAEWVAGDTVFIDSASVSTQWVIRHELLHALLQGPPPPSDPHPLEPFAFPCHLLAMQQPRTHL